MKPIEIIANAIQRERIKMNLSVSELAKRANIAKSTLSQLEQATGNPSIETLWAIANILQVPVSALIEKPKTMAQLIRADEGMIVISEQENYIATLLSASPSNARRDIYRLNIEMGKAKFSNPHPAGTIEHLIISQGKALAGPIDAPVELSDGDYYTYPADVPHIFEALTSNTKAVLIIESL